MAATPTGEIRLQWLAWWFCSGHSRKMMGK
jgi:hypothetical protein